MLYSLKLRWEVLTLNAESPSHIGLLLWRSYGYELVGFVGFDLKGVKKLKVCVGNLG